MPDSTEDPDASRASGAHQRRPITKGATGKLLRAAVDISDGYSNLAERREAMLECLASLTDSDVGFWTWARAQTATEPVIPLICNGTRATMEFGASSLEILFPR
jgi:hypothetical protein